MLRILEMADFQFIPIENKWFKGKIYIDKRAQIFPFQIAILEKFITQIIAKSNKRQKITLDFHIIISGDQKDSDFSVDLFAFIDDLVIDDQDVFNNAFSAAHWGLSSLFNTISQLYDDLLGRIPMDFFEDDPRLDLTMDQEEVIKKETIN